MILINSFKISLKEIFMAINNFKINNFRINFKENIVKKRIFSFKMIFINKMVKLRENMINNLYQIEKIIKLCQIQIYQI